MQTVRVSPKFQVVIPSPIREALGLAPGTKVQVFQYENRIEFIPEKKLRQMRGFLKGINTTVPRERACAWARVVFYSSPQQHSH